MISEGKWCFPHARNHAITDIITMINSVVIPSIGFMDEVVWTGPSFGDFSIKSATQTSLDPSNGVTWSSLI